MSVSQRPLSRRHPVAGPAVGVALAVGTSHLYTVWAASAGDALGRAAVIEASKLWAYCLVAASFIWFRNGVADRALETLRSRFTAHPLLVLAAFSLAVQAIAWWTTPQVAFGNGALGLGYGHDGEHYGWMSEHFAWFRHAVDAPFNGRFLLPLLVDLSGLDTFTAFRLVNALASLGSVLLMYGLAKSCGARPAMAGLAAVALGLMKYGVKYATAYPVITDAVGEFLLLAILLAGVRERYGWQCFALCCGIFVRENLLLLPVFTLSYAYRRDYRPGRLWRLALLQLVPLGLFAASRVFPVFEPAGSFEAVRVLGVWWTKLFDEVGRAQRVVLAYVNSLGPVLLLAWATRARIARWFGEHREWAAFVALHVALSLVSGYDVDRFALWVAPALLVALAVSAPPPGAPARGDAWLYLHLVALHAISMELFAHWLPSEAFYKTRHAVSAARGAVFGDLMTGALCLALAVAFLVAVHRSQSVERRATSERSGA